MGKCKFCGEKAGFLRWKHSECQSAHDKAPDILFKELLMVGERAVPDSIEIKNEGKGQIAISTEYNDEKLLEKLKEEGLWCEDDEDEAIDPDDDEGDLPEDEKV